jgi:pteridine reductase
MANSSLSSPVALVTGAAKRVGRAIALRLASAGYDIALTYLQSDAEAGSVVSDVRAMGRQAIAIRADLTNPSTAVDAIDLDFRQSFARLDVLVNNASIYQPSDLSSTEPDLIQRLMSIHVEAPLLLCKHFATHLRANRGHVINMVDLLAEKPWPKYMAYSASKAALSNLTISLARELAPEVTVNGIAPGAVEWPPDYPTAEKEKYLQRVPLGRAGTPEDVANLVHFLVTSGSYVTGQIIRLDGGRSIL